MHVFNGSIPCIMATDAMAMVMTRTQMMVSVHTMVVAAIMDKGRVGQDSPDLHEKVAGHAMDNGDAGLNGDASSEIEWS